MTNAEAVAKFGADKCKEAYVKACFQSLQSAAIAEYLSGTEDEAKAAVTAGAFLYYGGTIG